MWFIYLNITIIYLQSTWLLSRILSLQIFDFFYLNIIDFINFAILLIWLVSLCILDWLESYPKFYDAIKQAYPDIQIISNCDASGQPLNHPADLYDYHVIIS
jgi:hypothetical protein